jgi:hypothetical protein
MSAKITWIILLITTAVSSISCRTLFSSTELAPLAVQLPYMKNSSNECYYLDEFMPTPDALITGRNGHLALRYYSYKGASYKEWQNTKINLSFYSNDMRCWSLFEEFYTVN